MLFIFIEQLNFIEQIKSLQGFKQQTSEKNAIEFFWNFSEHSSDLVAWLVPNDYMDSFNSAKSITATTNKNRETFLQNNYEFDQESWEDVDWLLSMYSLYSPDVFLSHLCQLNRC